MAKVIKDIFTGEDGNHQIRPIDTSERTIQRAGLTLRRTPKSANAAEPLCRVCNAGPQCGGVDAGQPCPPDPTT